MFGLIEDCSEKKERKQNLKTRQNSQTNYFDTQAGLPLVQGTISRDPLVRGMVQFGMVLYTFFSGNQALLGVCMT